MAGYATWLRGEGADWLQGPNAQAFKGALGTEFDVQRNRLKAGLLMRYAGKGNVDSAGVYGLPPSDALDQIGADRKLPRGPGESDAAYSTRLLAAWDIWQFAGSHYGVLRALEVAGYDDMVVVQQNGRYARLTGSAGTIADLAFGTLMTCAVRPGDPPGWTFDLRDDFYSQFGLVFTANHANLSSTDGQEILNNIVEAWKPAKAFYVGAWVITAGRLLGWPTGRTLGTDPNLGGNTRYFIDP